MFEGVIVEKMLELNPVEVPEAVVELYIDSFVADVRRQAGGSLPDGFDEEAFRARYVDEAKKQSRWMLIRDRVIEEHALEVSEGDRLDFFKKTAGDGDVDPAFLAKYYDTVPGLGERLKQRLMSEKVFAVLADRFEVVDKDREALEAERKEQLEALRVERAAAMGLDDDDEKTSWWRRPIDRVRNQWKKPR
jgi:trigger factor